MILEALVAGGLYELVTGRNALGDLKGLWNRGRPVAAAVRLWDAHRPALRDWLRQQQGSAVARVVARVLRIVDATVHGLRRLDAVYRLESLDGAGRTLSVTEQVVPLDASMPTLRPDDVIEPTTLAL